MLRPLTPADVDTVIDLMDDAWGAPDRANAGHRVLHLLDTDPGGAWVSTDDDGTVVGVALALVREGIWGLSLLIVRSDHQSGGRGRELMRAATEYGADARGGIIMSSEDPRALRSYWRAGYTLRPVFDASGSVRVPPPASPAVRPAVWPQDRALVDDTGRAVRGAAHGPDADAWLATGRTIAVHDGGGFLVRKDERIVCVAATDARIASELLQTALAAGGTAEVDFLDAQQDWALDLVLEAGLELKPSGAVCVRGDVGPMRPYIPSGAYL